MKFIIYSEISWHFLDQRHHHLARYLASKGYKVEFVQRVVSRVPSIKDLWSMFFLRKNMNKIVKTLPEGILLRKSFFLPPTLIFSSIYNWLVWFLYERFKQKNAIVYSFVNNPYLIGSSMPIWAKYKLSVFDIIHNWWEFIWQKEKQKKLADKNINLYNKIVTDSPLIGKILKKNNVDFHLMLPGMESAWLGLCSESCNIKPVFYGNLRSNSDINLINTIGSHYNLSLIGLLDKSIVKNIKNYQYLGQLDSSNLIKNMNNYNLIVLPYNDDEFSKTIAPAKYFEAMATGALIVTSADMNHLPGFSDFVLQIKFNSDRFKEKIDLAFEEHKLKRNDQISFASFNLWDNRFKSLFNYLELK